MSELRKKMTRAMELKNFSYRTQETYLGVVKGLSKFYTKSADQLTEGEVEDYLLHLKNKGLSDSSRNVAVCALRFLYSFVLPDTDIDLGLPTTRRPRFYRRYSATKKYKGFYPLRAISSTGLF